MNPTNLGTERCTRKRKEREDQLFINNLKTFQNEKEFIHEHACNGKYYVCDIMFAG